LEKVLMAQVETTQAVKRATLENDRKVRKGSTYYSHAHPLLTTSVAEGLHQRIKPKSMS